MEIEKFVVILSSKNGHKNHLRITVFRDRNLAEIHLGKPINSEEATLYLFGDEIAETKVYKHKYDYKISFYAKNQIDVMLADGEEAYTGSTGKTPFESVLKRRVSEWQKSAQNLQGSHPSKHDESKRDLLDADENNKQISAVKVPLDFDDISHNENDVSLVGEVSALTSEQRVEEQNETSNGVDTVGLKLGQDIQDMVGHKLGENTDMVGRKLGAVEDTVGLKLGKASDMVGYKLGDRDESKTFSFDNVSFNGNNFYLSVKPQLDELFVCYPEEENLCKTVPNSRWVQVDTEDGFYVVGLVKDIESVSYICYGVPAFKGSYPPDEIRDFCVWLEVSERDGFWIIYQDALTGKCLK